MDVATQDIRVSHASGPIFKEKPLQAVALIPKYSLTGARFGFAATPPAAGRSAAAS
jgi:hypothetical protein